MLITYYLLTFTLTAAICDLATDRIGNPLILAGFAGGLVLHATSGSSAEAAEWLAGSLVLHTTSGISAGAAEWLAGALMPLAAGLILHRFRLMGAGDAKLLAAIGCMTGPYLLLKITFLSLLFGAVFSLLIMLFFTGFRERFRRLADYLVLSSISGGTPVHYRSGGGALAPEEFHFSVPVLMAVMYVCFR
ncbi:MAG: prepilin peptidase [Lachnospiraceae bacterium]|nr:prepilin peptidase [Lachnospiraceae bacterium]